MKLILSQDCKPKMWLAHLCSNLVAALAGLDVDNLPHAVLVVVGTSGAVAGRRGSEGPHPPLPAFRKNQLPPPAIYTRQGKGSNYTKSIVGRGQTVSASQVFQITPIYKHPI